MLTGYHAIAEAPIAAQVIGLNPNDPATIHVLPWNEKDVHYLKLLELEKPVWPTSYVQLS